jgi:hypothetical protein
MSDKLIVIISPPEMLYITKIFYRFFTSQNLRTKVVSSCNLNSFFETNEEKNILFFVYCIFQIPDNLKRFFKKNYIIYQLEQHRNNQLSHHYEPMQKNGFLKYYYKNALMVIDYCPQNISFLEKILKIKPQFLEVPIENLKNSVSTTKKTIDLLFMGSINEKRKLILFHLSQKYNLVVVRNCFFTELTPYFEKSKILLNIHFYENAILERVRINEGLHHGLRVLSEKPCITDSQSMEMYKDIVEFIDEIDLTNIDLLYKKIDEMLSTYEIEYEEHQALLKERLNDLAILSERNTLSALENVLNKNKNNNKSINKNL